LSGPSVSIVPFMRSGCNRCVQLLRVTECSLLHRPIMVMKCKACGCASPSVGRVQCREPTPS